MGSNNNYRDAIDLWILEKRIDAKIEELKKILMNKGFKEYKDDPYTLDLTSDYDGIYFQIDLNKPATLIRSDYKNLNGSWHSEDYPDSYFTEDFGEGCEDVVVTINLFDNDWTVEAILNRIDAEFHKLLSKCYYIVKKAD